MRRAFFFILAFLWAPLCWTVSSQTAASVAAPQQGSYTSYYVCNGAALQVVNGDPDGANYGEWHVWHYPKTGADRRAGAGHTYAHWGEVQGPSDRAAVKQHG